MHFDPHRVFHYGYVVPNMDRALKTWIGQGAELLVEPTVDPVQNVVCAFLTYMDAIPVELIAPLSGTPNPIAGRLAKGGGLDHVCLFSEDLRTDLARMKNEGAVTVVEPCYGAVFKRELAFVVTRSGLVVELMTRSMAPAGDGTDPLAHFLQFSSDYNSMLKTLGRSRI